MRRTHPLRGAVLALAWLLATAPALAVPAPVQPPATGGGGGGSGTVTSVGSGSGLAGGPITSSGSLALAPIATSNVLGNVSGASAAPAAMTQAQLAALLNLSQYLTAISGPQVNAALGYTALGAAIPAYTALANPTGASAGATAIAIADPNLLPLATGKWWAPPVSAGAVAVSSFIAGSLYALPVYIPAATTIKKYGFHITVANASAFNVEFALYADSGAHAPGTMVAGSDSGAQAIAASATGDQTTTLGSSYTLASAGWYWLALVISATGATVNGVSTGNASYTFARYVGAQSVAQALTAPIVGYGQGGVTLGSLPATFTGSTPITANVPAAAFGT